MTNRFPLILDQNEQKVKELPSGDNLDLTGNDISSVRNILPETNETYDLGSISLKWRDLYLSGNSIFIGNGSISLSNGVFTFTDENDQVITLSTEGTQFTGITANTITADEFIGDGSQVDNVDAVTLQGSDKSYFENYAETFANSAYANAVIYTDNEIAALINSAPGVLDTLNELSAAIDDDENFAVTITNQISNAYSNAVSDATDLASNAYSNAVSYTDGEISTLYTNVTSYADDGDAETYANAVAHADDVAGDAYANAVLYVDTEIGNLVNSAPGILDTLNELAEAIGDDDNFFVTVNNNINTAYSNAVSEAENLANSAYANAVSYVNAELGNLVNNAPGVLDTLNELADAIGDDENFFITVNNNINTAYSNAVSEATILANNAFTNAVAYVDEQTTDTIEEGNTNLYFTTDRVRDSLSVAGDLVYDSNTGQFSVTTYKSTDFDTDFSGKSTDELSEGNTNLYYLDSRVDSHLSGANGISYSSGSITADQDISSGANVTFTKVDGLNTPTTNTEATNKQYVDNLAGNAYSNAVLDATDLAGNAYSNAISYTDGEISTLYTNVTSYADEGDAETYANAVSYVDTEIANLVNTAPTVLDTLNELAEAINDDPNFANSVASQISTAYSNAVSEATELANNAYSNAVADAISLSNDAFTNAVAYVDEQTTDTIEEGNINLYYTDERARDSLSAAGDLTYDSNTGQFSVTTYKSADFDNDFSGKSTDELSEGNTNLYYLDSRVDSHLSGANGITYDSGEITADQDISSGANVTFTKVDGLSAPTSDDDATNKLYVDNLADTTYSNAVSYTDNEIAALVNSAPGVLNTLNELSEAINDDENFAVTVTNQISNAFSNAVSDAIDYVDSQTTDTIEEGSVNLYYTDERTRNALSVSGDLTYDSNTGEFSVTTYKSTDFDVDFSGKTSDELSEGNTNLYYLDSRVDSHLSGANGITYSSGAIAADQDISSGANVTFTKVDGLTTPIANTDATNKLYVDNLADTTYSNGTAYADGVADDAFTNAVSEATSLANDAYSNAISYTDGEIANLVNTAPVLLDTLNELAAAINDDPDFANSVTNQITTAYSNAVSEAITLANNAFTNAVVYVDEQTTDTIEEGANNLYHTEERVRDSLSSSGDLIYDSNTGEFSVVTYKSTDFDTDFSGKSTDDLTEGNTNLYFIEAPNDGEQYVRQNESWVTVDIPEGYDSNNFSTDFASQTTDELTEGSNNLYFTEERVVDAVENNTVNTVSVESSFILPVGNTSSRPSPAIVGMMRFNTELGSFEGYDGNQWVQFDASFGFEGDLNTLSGVEDLEEGSGTFDLN